jgi:hypothetical protein
LKEFSKTVDLSSTLRYHSLEMKGAKRGGSAERKNDSDDEETGPMDATKSQKRTGKPLPPLFPKHPKLPPPAELDEKDGNLVQLASYMRAYTRSTPYQVSAEKRRSYIERYQDRWDRRSDKTDIYSYIEPFISLLPEECVVGKAKRKWHAQTRGVDIDHPDVTELFGPLEDEEDGEEQSREDDEDESVEGENDLEDDDLEFEKMSDDESYGEDDGPDEATY